MGGSYPWQSVRNPRLEARIECETPDYVDLLVRDAREVSVGRPVHMPKGDFEQAYRLKPHAA